MTRHSYNLVVPVQTRCSISAALRYRNLGRMSEKLWSEMRISPSKVGALCVPDACERCYWILLRMKFRAPYSWPMPGVMFALDAHQKQLVRAILDKDKALPEFFGPFQDATELLEIESVSGFHKETGLTLFGKPDLVLKNAKGHLTVLDNKTAKKQPAEHPLTAKYIVQTNFYGYLLEQSEAAPKVTKVGILNYEFAPLTDEEILKKTEDDCVWTRFRPIVTEVTYDPESIVVPVLEHVRELIDQTGIPAGKEDCPDCKRLDSFRDLIENSDSIAQPYLTDREKRQEFYARRHRQIAGVDETRQSQLDSVLVAGEPGGVLAAWNEDGLF
jgi:hypothetical protein